MKLREILRAIKAAENLPTDAALAQILSQLYSEVAFRCFSPRAFEKTLSFGVFNAEVAALCNKYGRFEIAAEIYTALLNTAPRDASLWFGLGNALNFLESSKAESAYFRALDSLTPSLRASGVATSVAINSATEGDALESRTDSTSGLPRDGVAIARNDDSNANHASCTNLPTSRHCEPHAVGRGNPLVEQPTSRHCETPRSGVVAINSMTGGDTLSASKESAGGLPRFVASPLARNDDSNACHANDAELPTSRHCETPRSGVVAINSMTEGDTLSASKESTGGLPRFVATPLARNDDSIAPAIHTNLAFFYFNCGAFEKAFKHYEARKNLPNYKTPIQKINTNPRAEQILIYCEQGFGDSLMFGRFLRGLERAQITCLIQPELLSLFQNAFPNIYFTADINEAESKPFKAAHSLLSLPFIYGFNAPLDFALFPNAKIAAETNTIAICANSNSPLSRTKNAHKNTLLNFIKHRHPNANILDFSSDNLKNLGVKNFAQTAMLLKNAAKIYSIDSALLHLGASLEIPTAALLNHDLKWRFKKNLWYKNIEILPLKNFQKRT